MHLDTCLFLVSYFVEVYIGGLTHHWQANVFALCTGCKLLAEVAETVAALFHSFSVTSLCTPLISACALAQKKL
jgi:hypothetical protein